MMTQSVAPSGILPCWALQSSPLRACLYPGRCRERRGPYYPDQSIQSGLATEGPQLVGWLVPLHRHPLPIARISRAPHATLSLVCQSPPAGFPTSLLSPHLIIRVPPLQQPGTSFSPYLPLLAPAFGGPLCLPHPRPIRTERKFQRGNNRLLCRPAHESKWQVIPSRLTSFPGNLLFLAFASSLSCQYTLASNVSSPLQQAVAERRASPRNSLNPLRCRNIRRRMLLVLVVVDLPGPRVQ